MNTYRMNAVMAGALYFLGTVFGVLGGIIGGKVLNSLITSKPISISRLVAREYLEWMWKSAINSI